MRKTLLLLAVLVAALLSLPSAASAHHPPGANAAANKATNYTLNKCFGSFPTADSCWWLREKRNSVEDGHYRRVLGYVYVASSYGKWHAYCNKPVKIGPNLNVVKEGPWKCDVRDTGGDPYNGGYTAASSPYTLPKPKARAAHAPDYYGVKLPAKAWYEYRCVRDFKNSIGCAWNGIIKRPVVNDHARDVTISFDVFGTHGVVNLCRTTLRISHDYVVKSATPYQCSTPTR